MFKDYLRMYVHEPTATGDFARELLDDPDFPTTDDFGEMYFYLSSLDICVGALEAFELVFSDFENYMMEEVF